MEKQQTRDRVRSMNRIPTRLICLLGLVITFASMSAAQDVENFESPIPVLISEQNSSYALAVNPDNWRDGVPKGTSEKFIPGQRVTVFVTNIDLLPDEGANAFRVFAKDENGKRFRFSVESIFRLPRSNNIYALTLRIFDPNGYNGQPAPDSEIALTLSWRGNISDPVRLPLGARVRQSAGGLPTASRPQSPDVVTSGQLSSADRKRFMEQATFGPTAAVDSRIRRLGFRSWINEQVAMRYPTIPYPNHPLISFDANIGCGGEYGASPQIDACIRDRYWPYGNQRWLTLDALYGDAQLRRRMSWALHQIWVVSHVNIGIQRGVQEYIEILDRNAFGNYRDLMREMTLSPAMGEYLDMIRSTSQNPNENYPRELLQLFTIGLYMLNQDGTPVMDTQGNRIATYDQGKIDQFTKVFTGWIGCNNGLNSACSSAVPGTANFIDPMHVAFPANHDLTAKSLFNYPGAPNTTIAACTNCTTDDTRRAYANDSLNKTLDNIFHHPNVGPFIGKILIQHFVTSDPSPAYVSRVAGVFNNNGSGVRGDMKALIKAILLDPEARGSKKTDPTYGKLREPFQYVTNVLRSFGARASTPIMVNGVLTSPPASCQNKSDGVMMYDLYLMGQEILVPTTVFSYFPPDYVVPGTDILGPEFALANTGYSFQRNNNFMGLSFGWGYFEPTTTANPIPGRPCGTSIDTSETLAWATADPTGNLLIEGLNQKLMHGTMSEAMKSAIRGAINFPADAKVPQAIYLVTSSSQYQVQR